MAPLAAAATVESAPAEPSAPAATRPIARVVDRLGGPGRAWIWIEAALLLGYVGLRTADAHRLPIVAWLALAAVLALVHPVSGLVVLAAIAPFSEPLNLTSHMGARVLLVLAVAAGIVVEVVRTPAGRRPRRISWPVALAIVLGAASVAGIAVTFAGFGRHDAVVAAQMWISGPGTALVIFVAAAWLGWRGELRPLAVAATSAAIAGVISLADFADGTLVRGSILDWLLRRGRFDLRLTGIIPSPNAVAALVVAPTALLASAAVLGRSLPIGRRVLAVVLLAPLVVALYLTYSRAALLALFALAVILTWRLRPRLGALLLVVGVVVGVAVLPAYLASRAAAVGSGSDVDPSGFIVASDQLRLTAWGAAWRMLLDAPVLGHGYWTYGLLAKQYGDAVLLSPHNEWLRFAAEGGLAIGVLAVAWIAATLAALARIPGWLGAGALAATLGWAIAATFNNPLIYLQIGVGVFTIAGTGAGLAWSRRARLAAAKSAAPNSPVPVPAQGDGAA